VRDVRSLFLAAGLTALFAVSNIAIATAAEQKASASYRTNVTRVQASASDTPGNCIREACGRLWCWNTGKQVSSK
jgi:hypothetical protein